jgi:L-alanine-DL-glutamate epimerase-like enolase superfamily enzyme
MKINKITTFQIQEYPLSVFVQVHVDNGLFGLGESTNVPLVVADAVHNFCAPALLGREAGDIESIWNSLYHKVNFQGLAGAEMRAMSAIDLALWDILGKSCGLPVWKLLGGKVRDRVTIYNTCGSHNGRLPVRPDDVWFREDAGALAKDLIKDGIHAMKIWPLDPLAAPTNGQSISESDIKKGFEPLAKIRSAVGGEMKIFLECHSLWNIPSAIRIARECEKYNVAWLEDPILVDDIRNLRMLREKINVPLLASERLCTRMQYLPLLSMGAADIVMVDLSWSGGLTEGKKIASAADACRIPVTTHNCGGPVLTKACAHYNLSTYNAIEMETVRASYRSFHEITDSEFNIQNGTIYPGDEPGLGVVLHQDLPRRKGVVSRTTSV